MRVFINAGHSPNGNPDPGACNSVTGLRECDVAKNIADLVEKYLTVAGVSVSGNLQSDSLYEIVSSANNLDVDVFVSIHCNACNGKARGTEVWHYHSSRDGKLLAECIQRQIVDAIGSVDRGIKGAIPGQNGLYVLTNTDAVSVLIETAFIDNMDDEELLRERQDEFARAIARGITDFEQETLNR